jgi:hypothetical protein
MEFARGGKVQVVCHQDVANVLQIDPSGVGNLVGGIGNMKCDSVKARPVRQSQACANKAETLRFGGLLHGTHNNAETCYGLQKLSPGLYKRVR